MNMPSQLHVLPLTKEVQELYETHKFWHDGDSGIDLFVAETKVIRANDTQFIKLGIKATAFGEDKSCQSFLIFPRSSMSRTPLRLSNSIGLIDSGFRGEIMISVDNIKNYDFEVKSGDRLVQAVLFDGKPFELKIVTSLNNTSRGAEGWGSTGMKKSS